MKRLVPLTQIFDGQPHLFVQNRILRLCSCHIVQWTHWHGLWVHEPLKVWLYQGFSYVKIQNLVRIFSNLKRGYYQKTFILTVLRFLIAFTWCTTPGSPFRIVSSLLSIFSMSLLKVFHLDSNRNKSKTIWIIQLIHSEKGEGRLGLNVLDYDIWRWGGGGWACI